MMFLVPNELPEETTYMSQERPEYPGLHWHTSLSSHFPWKHAQPKYVLVDECNRYI